MEKSLPIKDNTLKIDSLELLIRFIMKCKNEIQNDRARAEFVTSCADIVSAVYYYRKFPNVNDFINKYLKDKENYFQLQWTRTTWASLSKMTEHEISDLVINQICFIDNSEEGQ